MEKITHEEKVFLDALNDLYKDKLKFVRRETVEYNKTRLYVYNQFYEIMVDFLLYEGNIFFKNLLESYFHKIEDLIEYDEICTY